MTVWRLPKPTMTRKPKYAACHYRLDLMAPTEEVLLDAYRAAKDKTRWLTLPYRSLPMGSEFGQCWKNVAKAIQLWGGEAQVGWYFHDDPLPGQRNCLSDIEAIAHAVWRSPDGVLVEVSEECQGAPFFPSEVVQPLMALNVGFCDDLFNASTYRPINPALAAMSGNIYCKLTEAA